jgi:hypothetical protein
MKVCFKCQTEKPYDEFYKHPEMADGHLGKCKECAKKDVRERRLVNHDHYLEYDRVRSRTRERLAGIARSQKRYPIKERARRTLHNAVARGKITKQPCQVCGVERVDAHHADYSKPLEVTWLCRRHHMEHHRTPRGCTGTKATYKKV